MATNATLQQYTPMTHKQDTGAGLTATHSPKPILVSVGVDKLDAASPDENLPRLGVSPKLVSHQGLRDLLGTPSPVRLWLRRFVERKEAFMTFAINCKSAAAAAAL